MPRAALGDRELYYARRGSGAPLLLIQGLAGHHRIWGEPFLSRLEPDFDVVAYDHRGVGQSTDVPGPFTTSELASDAAVLLDVLGWDRAHVLGISMGGMVAQELALARPDRVRSLVLGCTYAGGAGSSLAAPGPARMLEAMTSKGAEAAVRAAYEANLSAPFIADESHFAPFRSAALSVAIAPELIMRQAQAAFAHDTSARLPGLDVATLVVHGTADEMLVYSNGEQIAGLIPAAHLHPMPGIGHLFWWERPEESAELVAAHCRAV